MKYEVILLLIVYYMKQVPEANWRPSFRLREKRRVVSSYVGVMTRMKQSKGGARRPKAKKKKKNGSLASQLYLRVRKLDTIESEKV